MDTTFSRVDTLNVHAERSLLTAAQLQRWQGLPIGWFDAAPERHGRNFLVTRPLLALLDTGRAETTFDFGLGARRYALSAGALRVFDGRQACRRNDWLCQAARRITLDLDSDGRFDEPELLDGLRQDLDFHDDGLAGLLRAMVREVAEGCPHGELYAQTLSIGVLQRLQGAQGRGRGECGGLSPAQLGRVDAYIAENLAGTLSLTALAEAAGYSRAHFVRLFKRSRGSSPHSHVMKLRLDRARELVSGSALSMSEIASATGFSSQSHLSTAFSRAFHCTPGVLRRASGRPAAA